MSFSISFWDLIKFPYFAGTTKRGDRRWKQAQGQGDVMTHTIDRKISQLKICHPFKKNKTLIFTHEKKGQSGPVFGLMVRCVLDAWERGRFFVSWCLGTGGLSPSFPTPWNMEQPQDWALLLEAQNNLLQWGSLHMNEETDGWSDGWMDGWQDRWMKWCFTTSFTICNEEEVQARSPMLNKNSCWVVSSLTWSLNQCWASIEFLLITIVVVDSSILEIFKSQKHPVPVLWGKLDLIRRNENQRKNCWFRLFQKPQRKT